MTRRVLQVVLLAAASAAGCARQAVQAGTDAGPARARPNILLIITDDQGFGDVGFHGNDKVRTPNLDRLAQQSVAFTQFYVSPVCAPTRASLLTGRYNYRTGVVDTYLGRAMMRGDEVTLAESLRAGGYATGIFGKWHLGDNYPLRPQDQGFNEVLVHRGGGIGQPSDPPGGERYSNPILFHNGAEKQFEGYVTDLLADAAIRFIEKPRAEPFFAYFATNAPHTPLDVPEHLVEPYRAMGLDDVTAKVYAMVENIDQNVGRLLRRIEELDLAKNTIIIFMTDNGPQQRRFNAGLRGAKGSVYEGGIRVPFLIRWPGRLQGGRKVDAIAAHIDVMPTLLELCGVPRPANISFDGLSLAPLLFEKQPLWAERTLFFQWHRGDEPVAFRDCAARTQRYKLVNGRELYDIQSDPAESSDVAHVHPEIVQRLREQYERWLEDVTADDSTIPPRIVLGSSHENPATLTRQDWRGPRAGWRPDSLGHWEVQIARDGDYRFTLRFAPAAAAGEARIQIGDVSATRSFREGATACRFDRIRLLAGPARLEAALSTGGEPVGPHQIDVYRTP